MKTKKDLNDTELETFSLKKSIFPFSVIVIVAFFVFFPSFSMALFGDDWLAFYRYRYHYGIWSEGINHSISYFLSPYGAQDFWMGTLEQFFGLSATPYYVVSLLMRLLATFTLFFVIKRFTSSTLSAFLGSLFFAISSIGLDATNWVFNMPSYLAITFLAFSFYFLLFSQKEKYASKVLYAGLFYYLAFLAAPIRMHLLPLLTLAVDGIWFLKERNKKTFVRIIKRQLFMVLVFILLRNTGYLLGSSDEATGRIHDGFLFIVSSFIKGDYYILLHPFVIVGRMLIPETILPFLSEITSPITYRSIFISVCILFLPLLLYYYHLTRNKRKTVIVLGILLCIGIVVKNALTSNIPLLHDPAFSGAALLGFFLTFFAILFSFTKNTSNSKFILFSLLWIFLSFAYPYIWTPQSTFGTHHRYFITTGAGLSLLFGGIASLAKTGKQKSLITFIILFFIVVHSFVTYSFFEKLVTLRGQEITNKVWGSMPKIEAIEKQETPLVFYFEGNPAILYHVITFGFPPHIAVLYNIQDGGKLPIATTDWDEVLEMTTKGEKMHAYGFPKEPLPLEKFYAFRLKDDGTLEDKTMEKRELLKDNSSQL